LRPLLTCFLKTATPHIAWGHTSFPGKSSLSRRAPDARSSGHAGGPHLNAGTAAARLHSRQCRVPARRSPTCRRP
jgi:hypothetical protein